MKKFLFILLLSFFSACSTSEKEITCVPKLDKKIVQMTRDHNTQINKVWKAFEKDRDSSKILFHKEMTKQCAGNQQCLKDSEEVWKFILKHAEQSYYEAVEGLMWKFAKEIDLLIKTEKKSIQKQKECTGVVCNGTF